MSDRNEDPDALARKIAPPEWACEGENPYHAPSTFSARAELASGTLCASVTLQGVAGEVGALLESLGRLARDLDQAPGHDVGLALRHRAAHISERLGHLVQSVNDARDDLEGKPF